MRRGLRGGETGVTFTGKPGVAVTDLRLVMRGLTLVDGLSLKLAPGEVLAVQGASGAGKTTFLRTLAGLIAPASGTVDTGGGKCAMVFQEPRLLPWYSARKNIGLALPHASVMAEDWLARVGLADAADLFPEEMSGGMRQRAAIARALCSQPSLLLVDEPFSALNPELAANLRVLLLQLIRTQQIATVWVTHNPEEAEAVSSSLLHLDGPPGTFSLKMARQTVC